VIRWYRSIYDLPGTWTSTLLTEHGCNGGSTRPRCSAGSCHQSSSYRLPALLAPYNKSRSRRRPAGWSGRGSARPAKQVSWRGCTPSGFGHQYILAELHFCYTGGWFADKVLSSHVQSSGFTLLGEYIGLLSPPRHHAQLRRANRSSPCRRPP
jgi:hypothetical protein